jgi:plasmid stabilization system protein ParE
VKLRWTDVANEDLRRLYRFRLGPSPDAAEVVAAKAVIAELRMAVRRLIDFPLSAPVYGNLRRLVWGPYSIFYRVKSGQIMVIRVRHGKELPLEAAGEPE